MFTEVGNKKTQPQLGAAVLYRAGVKGFCGEGGGGGTSSQLHVNTKRRDRNSITGKWKSPVVWQWLCLWGLWLRDDTIKVLLYFAWWGRVAASPELLEGTLMSSACHTPWQEASLLPGAGRKWMNEGLNGICWWNHQVLQWTWSRRW